MASFMTGEEEEGEEGEGGGEERTEEGKDEGERSVIGREGKDGWTKRVGRKEKEN